MKPSLEEVLAVYGQVKLLEARWRPIMGKLPGRERDVYGLMLVADVLEWVLDGVPAGLAVIDCLTEKAKREDEEGVPYEHRGKL